MTENSSGKRPLEHDDEDRSSKRSAINSDTVFRLLVESKKVGSVIGKAGSVIKSLREETGAKIKVLDAVMGCDERVIMISGVDDPAAPFSTAQEALFRTHQRLCDGDVEAGIVVETVTTKMLVYGSQAGCLIGKGGEIIKMIREGSGSTVRIMPPDQLPMCAEPNDRVVQMTGEVSNLRTCLQMISKQLRENPPRETREFHGGQRGGGMQGGMQGGMPPMQGGMQGGMQVGMQGGMQDPYGMQQMPQQYFQQPPQQQPPPQMPPPPTAQQSYNMPQQGYQQQQQYMQPPPQMQPSAGGYGGHGGMGQGAMPAMPAMGGGGCGATNVSSKMTIPNASVGAVIGKGGSNISQVRQISGARVKIHELEQGSQERVLEMSGTNEQVLTAQQLVQAFIANGGASAPPMAAY